MAGRLAQRHRMLNDQATYLDTFIVYLIRTLCIYSTLVQPWFFSQRRNTKARPPDFPPILELEFYFINETVQILIGDNKW